ncbi:hypothetical protein PLICRDRAFT_172107 [Plicaturopsis crispa FD-325 SS-3]|nr:hypothetical protein PLICRDRAFT_172107 [Plicaturopsis crispa FD-325 SS-3]
MAFVIATTFYRPQYHGSRVLSIRALLVVVKISCSVVFVLPDSGFDRLMSRTDHSQHRPELLTPVRGSARANVGPAEPPTRRRGKPVWPLWPQRDHNTRINLEDSTGKPPACLKPAYRFAEPQPRLREQPASHVYHTINTNPLIHFVKPFPRRRPTRGASTYFIQSLAPPRITSRGPAQPPAAFRSL